MTVDPHLDRSARALSATVRLAGGAWQDVPATAHASLAMEPTAKPTLGGSSLAVRLQKPDAPPAIDDATRYAAEDSDITLRLHGVLSARLAAEPTLQRVYRDIEMPLVSVLERIEANGVSIDMDELRRQSADLSQRMFKAQTRAHELAGRMFNLDSTKQLGQLLYEELKLPALVKTPGGAPSTNEEALEAIAELHELPRRQ